MADQPRRPRIGARQMEILAGFGAMRVMITSDAASRRLAGQGLLRVDAAGGSCITPAGLRALADAMEAGALPDALTTLAAAKSRREANG